MECIKLWCVVVCSVVLGVHAKGKWLNGSIWGNATLAFHTLSLQFLGQSKFKDCQVVNS